MIDRFSKNATRFLIFFSVFSFLFVDIAETAFARSEYISISLQRKQKGKSSKKSSKKTTKKTSKSKKKVQSRKSSRKKQTVKKSRKETRSQRARRLKANRRSSKKPAVKRIVKKDIEIHQALRDTLLAPGVQYRHLILGRERHSVHVVKANITNPAYSLEVLKGIGRVDGMERLSDMVVKYDSTRSASALTAVNGNFWSTRALPIGPLIIDGEVVQMGSHKQWSSAFLTPENQLFIDSFKLKGSVKDTRGRNYTISSVNFRSDSTGLVMYNSYAGDTIPYVSPFSIDKQLEEMEKNRVDDAGDSTEAELSLEYLRNELTAERRSKSIESQMTKIQLRYLRSPVVNGKVACRVLTVGAGDMQMPARGCILSLGKNYSWSSLPKEGDTLFMEFTTNYYKDVEFTNAVSGTPRLVRHGVAGHEAYSEGSTAKRFIMNNLARTAIGTDEKGEHIYLVSIDATGRQEDCVGATLSQTADILEYLGLYDAMNLDGGGSTTMSVGQEIVTHQNTVAIPRKLSVGLAITKKAFRRRD